MKRMQHPDKHTCNNTSKNTNETLGSDLCNIHIQPLQHMQHSDILLQHSLETIATYAPLKHPKHLKGTLATCVFSTSQHLLAACEMEARQHVEFTGGSHAVATIGQMDPTYYEAGGDPFVAAGIMGSTRSPCSQRRSPHHHRISCCAVDLLEGAAR
jgi:hypothetical protein